MGGTMDGVNGFKPVSGATMAYVSNGSKVPGWDEKIGMLMKSSQLWYSTSAFSQAPVVQSSDQSMIDDFARLTGDDGPSLRLTIGAKNLTDAYQEDLDRGQLRDSSYVYGPRLPRTYFVGVKFEL